MDSMQPQFKFFYPLVIERFSSSFLFLLLFFGDFMLALFAHPLPLRPHTIAVT